MAKQIMFDDNARQKMRAGIEKLAKTVRVTLGPGGRNVILQKSFGAPLRHQGRRVRRQGDRPRGPLREHGRQARARGRQQDQRRRRRRHHDGHGPGLRDLRGGPEVPRHGRQPGRAPQRHRQGRRGRRRGTSPASRARSSRREEKANVAAISANNDPEIGDLLADAFERVGDEGVDHGRGEQGRRDSSSRSSRAWSSTRATCRPTSRPTRPSSSPSSRIRYILIHEKKVSNAATSMPVLELRRAERPPAPDHRRGHRGRGARHAGDQQAARHPERVSRSRRPASASAARPTWATSPCSPAAPPSPRSSGSRSRRSAWPSTSARAKRVIVVSKDRPRSSPAPAPRRRSRTAASRSASRSRTTKSDYDREKLEERLAKLTGRRRRDQGRRQHRGRDEGQARTSSRTRSTPPVPPSRRASCPAAASRCCAPSRPSPTARYQAATRSFGALIVEKALEMPPAPDRGSTPASDGSVVVETVREKGKAVGYNALTTSTATCSSSGVIDPAKVVRSALQNAASIAACSSTTDSMVTEIKDETRSDRRQPRLSTASGTSPTSAGGVAARLTRAFPEPAAVLESGPFRDPRSLAAARTMGAHETTSATTTRYSESRVKRTPPTSSGPTASSPSSTTPTRTRGRGRRGEVQGGREAYDVLGDESKRQQYDQFGHAAFGPGGQYSGPSFTNIEDILRPLRRHLRRRWRRRRDLR